MLGLQLETDPVWVKNAVEGNISEILTDHAYCEQKAASHAISRIVLFPDLTELVDAMTDLAREEMAHFKLVHELIQARGFTLGKERKDDYVNELLKFVRKGHGRDILLMDKLLFKARLTVADVTFSFLAKSYMVTSFFPSMCNALHSLRVPIHSNQIQIQT